MSVTYHINRIIRLLGGKKRPHTTGILLAAGLGTRMQTKDGKTKQLLPLRGVPILVHAARAFEKCPYIDDIVVVCRAEELNTVRGMMADYRITKFRAACIGGATRQESALRGFEAADGPRLGCVAIHDAARCLVTPKIIADVVSTAYAGGAAAAGTRVHDTVKKTDGNGYVTGTVDRDDLWFAATPQAFFANIYRAAAYTARDAKFRATDDVMLCERIGQAVKMVDCGDENFKITTGQDLVRAELVLRARESRT